jgi:hypothetical protein
VKNLGKLYSILAVSIFSIILIYIFNLTGIYYIYNLYYSESVWGVIIATIDHIVFIEKNFIVNLPILLSISFLGGIISKNYRDAFYSSLISGIIMALTWIILVLRFSPIYWTENFSGFLIFEIILRGLLLSLIYVGPSILGGYIISKNKSDQSIIKYPDIETICPKCGRKFKSNPIYCSYCNSEIKKPIE